MTYKVKKGDTLSGIAKAHNISLDELLKLNGISKDKANSVSVGQELKISQPSPSTETPEFQVPAVNTQFVMGMNWKPTPKPEDSNMGVPYTTGYTKQAFVADHAKTIQEQLIAAGYSVGSAGADGKWGKNSQSALDRALAEGYTLKGDKLIKPQLKPRSATATTQISNSYLKSNAEAIQKQLMAAGYNVGSHGADGKWGSDSQKALELAFSEGYTLKDGKLVNPNIRVAQPARPGVVGSIKNHMSNDIYDNMYPYNYGDVKNSNGTYRQVSGSDPVEVQFKAGLQKFISGTQEMDPRRDLMNQMAALDLNTSEGMDAWKKLVEQADKLNLKMVRYKGTTPEQIKNQQWEMRARLDAMNLYQGRPQQWNTFIEQTDESKLSGRATKAGKPTLIIGDRGQRNRINGELLNYWNAHPEQRVKGENGLYRMPIMSYLGNATIVQQEDGSLRYADDWDYTWTSDNDPNRPYFGEVLSDFSGKGYGTGVNSRSFNEGLNLENLFNEGVKYITQQVNPIMSNPVPVFRK